MMKKIIVFGGSGFLGSHVCDKLSDSGYDVVIFDIRKSPYLRTDQTMMIGDILNEEAVRNAVSGSQYVFNFAGIADIDEAKDLPIETIQYNVLGNTIILNACRKEKINRFIFASSVYVYSKSGGFYRVSKQACENYIEAYHEMYGLKYTILRFGTLYGPRSDKRNAVYRFVLQALTNGSISYEGNREDQREYIHTEDAAKACVDILKPEFENQHIVLTGSQVFKVRELLGMIKEIIPDEITINYKSNNKKTAHYVLTPHNYSPKLGKKFIPSLQVDLGQGLLHQVETIYRELHPEINKI
ncbi:NAD-dependent epimerase/dehydratase family protein [Desulfobacula toluolica]|uniref:NAD-dependent epimerase/dehydratase n=1 Tax=Desulfobacula toluolica (strain DSM 7467 / Tol2) TaxID=651182 RepID=K0NH62_DESTT|nr:NAD(P)-dependent oxidoreductase [Desulfobacula toluolica]CCK80310.1 NAD-dependent epimerase/dehydratase [Desulfobacula toluolica Tol2]